MQKTKSRFLVSIGLVGLAVPSFATDPDPAFDWSSSVTALQTTVSDTLGANIAAVMGVFAFFVAIGLVWKLLRKAGARTR